MLRASDSVRHSFNFAFDRIRSVMASADDNAAQLPADAGFLTPPSRVVTRAARGFSRHTFAIIYNTLFMSVYGHKALFETRVSGPRRAGFQKVALGEAQKNEDEFFETWKQYRALNPAVKQDAVEDVDSETERIRKEMQGSDDDEDGSGPAGPPAAAAEAASAAAAVDLEGN